VNTPSYVKALLQPNGKGKVQGRRVWGMDLEMVWLTFFLATNAMGETQIPAEDLGAPLRLNHAKDGSIKFTQSGRPSLKVAPELNRHIRIVRENFEAGLVAYAGSVQAEHGDAYRAQVERAQQAGRPILQAQAQEVEEAARRRREAEAAQQAQAQPETQQEKSAQGKERERVAATA
jgi:hypothetical protein